MASASLVLRASCVPNNEIRDVSCASSRCVGPWLMLPPENFFFKFYRVAEGDVIRVQAEQHDLDSVCVASLSKGWLVCTQRKDCHLFMFNPLFGKTLQLPSFETFPCVKGVILNALSGVVESVLNHDSHPITPQDMSKYIVRKMVLSSPDPMDEDCIAMVIYGPHQLLAFCTNPTKANSWTPLHGPLNHYAQIVFHSEKKLFFAITDDKELEAWDLHNYPIKRFLIHNEHLGGDCESWPCPAADDDELELKTDYCTDADYLVYDHQSHDLFIVTRYTAHGIDEDDTLVSQCPDNPYLYKSLTFDVFKLDFIDHDHVELQLLEGNFGNHAFFVGSNPGFALSTTMFPELRPNSIYFTDDLTDLYMWQDKATTYGGHDLGIFDYKDRSFLPCYYPNDVHKIQRIQPPPVWFTPDVDATCLASAIGL